MQRNIEEQIRKIERRLSDIYAEHGSRFDVSLRRTNAQSRGDTAEIRRLKIIYNKIQRNETKLNELRSRLLQEEAKSFFKRFDTHNAKKFQRSNWKN